MISPRLLRLASVYQVVSAVLLALAASFLSPGSDLAVLAGGGLMALNFGLLRVLVAKTLSSSGPRAVYALGLGFKFVFMLGLMMLMLVGLKLDPVGVMVGLGSLFFGLGAALAHQSLAAGPLQPSSSRS